MSPSTALWGGACEDSSDTTGNAGTDGGDGKCSRCEVNKGGNSSELWHEVLVSITCHSQGCAPITGAKLDGAAKDDCGVFGNR